MTCQTRKRDLLNPAISWLCGADADYISLLDGTWMCFECAEQQPKSKPDFVLSPHILGHVVKVCTKGRVA